MNKNVNLKVEITQNFWLDLDTAVPCGLILNELISNALKYAFGPNTSGELQVRVEVNQEQNPVLIVADNGRGFPKDFDFKNTKTLGLILVRNLTDQIRGEIEVSNCCGTQYKITLPDTKASGK